MSRWTDEDGEPLGEWVEITHDEQRRIVEDAGGPDALTVFATFTDPPYEVYTAWGRPDDDAPLIDIRTLNWHKPAKPEREVYRKFVLNGADARVSQHPAHPAGEERGSASSSHGGDA